MKHAVWVVTANSGRASVYQASSHSAYLEEVAVLVHPESRMHTTELTSDLPGRAFDSAGEGRHIMETPVDPKREEAIRFAKTVADFLNEAHLAHRFDTLHLAAAPAFLGLLRSHMHAPLRKTVQSEIDKDLTSLAMAELRGKIDAFL